MCTYNRCCMVNAHTIDLAENEETRYVSETYKPCATSCAAESTMENTTYNKGDKLMTNLEGFEKLIEDTVSGGLHTMVLALGHRVGLVETFFRLGRPATAREISKEAGLNLRYRFYFSRLWLTS